MFELMVMMLLPPGMSTTMKNEHGGCQIVVMPTSVQSPSAWAETA